MICSLILGRKGSIGFPGKNLHKINGNPLAWYPMQAALNCKDIDMNFISTDDPELMKLGEEVGFEVIKRPAYLATSEALGEDAYKHGYEKIVRKNDENIELLVLLFCNAPTVSSELISKGIKALKDNPDAESAVTVSKYNMFSPSRARRINNDGFLQPFIVHPQVSQVICEFS